MNEDKLVNEVYGQIKRYLISRSSKLDLYRSALVLNWETKNKVRIKESIRHLLHNEQLNDEIVPPPKYQFIHIGEGIFIEVENPELNCEVTQCFP